MSDSPPLTFAARRIFKKAQRKWILNDEDRARLFKALSYRVFSTFITVLIALIFTGNLAASFSVGALDILVKVFSFYQFDKLWNRSTTLQLKPAVIWITGLSGAGKSTIAQQLKTDLNKRSVFPIMLDGDEIRNFVGQTGFDERSRKLHNLNVGFMSTMLEKQGNLVIVSLISPFAEVREEIRRSCHRFIEVYVSTPIETCMDRDPKGLYKKALNGEIKQFTGLTSPYEAPSHPEITIETRNKTVEECAKEILNYLKTKN